MGAERSHHKQLILDFNNSGAVGFNFLPSYPNRVFFSPFRHKVPAVKVDKNKALLLSGTKKKREFCSNEANVWGSDACRQIDASTLTQKHISVQVLWVDLPKCPFFHSSVWWSYSPSSSVAPGLRWPVRRRNIQARVKHTKLSDCIQLQSDVYIHPPRIMNSKIIWGL